MQHEFGLKNNSFPCFLRTFSKISNAITNVEQMVLDLVAFMVQMVLSNSQG